MNVLIVYDSYFGNTEKIALSIGDAFRPLAQVTTARCNDPQAASIQGADLLIVGSPTRGFRASEGMQAYLKAIPAGALQGKNVAAFDTRMSIEDIPQKFVRWLVRTFGYAAKPIAGQLTAKGGSLIAEPEGFLVLDREGPLKEGELERAADWAKKIKASIG